MKIEVKVIPAASKVRVAEESGRLKVYLTAPPVDGRANEMLVETLAEYFSVRRSAITVIKGLKSRSKTVNINIS